MKNQKKQDQTNSRVEFGTEFGDINAAKAFEIPFMNKKEAKDKKKC